MNANQKFCLSLAGAAALAASAYYIYKKCLEKETKKTYVIPLTDSKGNPIKDLKKNMDDKVAVFSEESEETEETEETEKIDSNGFKWEIDSNGVEYRLISSSEIKYGVDYNPYSEAVEDFFDESGNPVMRVVKLKTSEMLNSHDNRAPVDVIESVKDMVSSIMTLKNNNMEYRIGLYSPLTLESVDYYIAMLFVDNNITNGDLQSILVILSTYEIKGYNEIGYDIYDDILSDRQKYYQSIYESNRFDSVGVYGACPFIRRITFAELFIFLAKEISYVKTEDSIEDILSELIDRVYICVEDRDVVINDILISFITHDRLSSNSPDGLYGVFSLSEDEYRSLTSFEEEFEFYMDRLQDERGEELNKKMNEYVQAIDDEDEDEE